MRKIENLVNRVFGDFRVKPEHENRNNRTYWKCLCKKCNYEKWITRSNLLAGNGTTCPRCKEEKFALRSPAICNCGNKILKNDTSCKLCNVPKTLEMVARYRNIHQDKKECIS